MICTPYCVMPEENSSTLLMRILATQIFVGGAPVGVDDLY